MQLRNVIRETVKLLRASLPTTIAIQVDIRSETPITADPTQMHQVVMNLATNAAHAMEGDGGRLAITLDDLDQGADGLIIDGMEGHDKVVQLTVRDTGKGIAPAVLGRIFDPYFTTKVKGKGTGMGLAVVHGIVKSYGGEIQVESQPGQGSSFRVFLPVADVKHSVDKGPRAFESAAGGSESILLVDDEPQLVDLLRIMLSSMGYRVSAFTDSREAMRAFEVNPGEFQLVMTDMTMPGMTGQELARRVLQVRPELPVILATGFSERINEEKAYRMGIRKFLYKPIMRKELAAAVREALESGKKEDHN
ncbi:MAG: response regulator [Desulfosarcina sp.]|nr:response regulator [Desulfobacterales bacterium]